MLEVFLLSHGSFVAFNFIQDRAFMCSNDINLLIQLETEKVITVQGGTPFCEHFAHPTQHDAQAAHCIGVSASCRYEQQVPLLS